jgi:L-alanine-DL-glutamate epimerase-like enolase superfamily enzyme
MARITPRRSPGKLASLLEALAVRVESARVEDRSLSLSDYPGGPRPSSVVRVTGKGCSGFGENVAFYAQEHERFAVYVARWFAAGANRAGLSVQTALGTGGTPYERAALEAALIDLALRQAGLSLSELTGVPEASLRFVKSLAADPEPEAVIRRLRERGFHGELKVDVDPSWDARVLEALARDSSIAIFDFKGRAEAALVRRLYAAHSSALFEDPPVDFEDANSAAHSRVSRDASLLDEGAVAAALALGQSVNLKAPRMGGPLAVLRGLEHSWAGKQPDSRSRAYLGGMFEIDVGRTQARQLAALYCASAPNDLALNVASTRAERAPAEPPARVRLDEPGFG